MVTLLLDGHNLLFRAFTSLPSAIVGPDEQPINAVYGMIASILRLYREHEAQHLIAAFDELEVPNFRQNLYPRYQAQRGPLGGERAPDFARQVQLAREILPRLGIPAVSQPGYEADDVIGTLACRLAAEGERAILVSTDRDLLQLVQSGIEVVSPGNPPRHIRNAEGVRQVLGVAPQGVTTFKALAGDASDNVPGVAGIGTKSAAWLVNEYGSLENIYAHLEDLPRRMATALEAGRVEAVLFHEVVTIVTNLELQLDVRELPQPRFTAESNVRGLLDQVGYAMPPRETEKG